MQIKVKSNARNSVLMQPTDGRLWLAQLKSPPVDGKANQELIGLVAKYFACPISRVTIKSGMTGRVKRVQIDSD